MSRFKEKTQTFIMGLMVGLLIAGSFFILKLDDYFKELNFYKTFIHTFTSETKTPETTEKLKEEKLDNQNKSTQPTSKHNFSLGNDSSQTEVYDNGGTVQDEDTITSSLSSNDSLGINSDSEGDIVVKKDELISTKTMEVIVLNPVSASAKAKDSLLQKISGITDDKNAKQLFNIEFWQSPINYKGYKMSKYKIVLYGIASADAVKVFKTDDAIYLKNQTTVYKLDYASELRGYERISDESIISKLK